ncbi:MAG: plastocyanin/azurin family copper-binding protein [Thermoplasmatota archaeon]
MQSTLLVSLLALSAVALAGCTGGSSDFETPPMDDQGRYVIEMVGTRFEPANAQVPVGATVLWVYVSGGAHDVQANDGSFSSGAPGDMDSSNPEWERTFDAAGTIDYHCAFHGRTVMPGTLKVA